MGKPVSLTQAISDGEQLQRLQLAMFQSAQAIIKRHAPGLPLDVLETYMKQLGGDLVVVSKERPGLITKEFRSFRVRVTVVAGRIRRVVGWG